MFFKKLKEKRQIKNSISSLGQVIDMPFKNFKRQIRRQKVNVGIMNNLILSLTTLYTDLYNRKSAIMQQIEDGKLNKEDSEVMKSLNGCYAEMIKIEQKVLWLRERVKKLSDVG